MALYNPSLKLLIILGASTLNALSPAWLRVLGTCKEPLRIDLVQYLEIEGGGKRSIKYCGACPCITLYARIDFRIVLLVARFVHPAKSVVHVS